jgi:septal ring-binding cell division protein DamX
MDQRGLRDVERWRDKIEVRLDNRQVFFLFFGSALVACLLFVLGVVVGKRLESRGRAVAPDVEDPLALLDKVATTPRSPQTPAMTFPQTLFGGKNGQSKKTELKPVEPKGTEASKSNPAQPAETGKPTEFVKKAESSKAASVAPDKAATKASPGRVTALLDSKPAEPGKAAQPKPMADKPMAAVPAGAPKPAVPASVSKPSKAPIVAAPATPPPAEVTTAPSTNASVPVIGAVATESAKGKAHFTLQLSSFQSRGEAEAFAAKFGSEKTYLVTSEIPGKGTWYRVRVGDFATAKDAIAGKLAFEKAHGVIAYVAQR